MDRELACRIIDRRKSHIAIDPSGCWVYTGILSKGYASLGYRDVDGKSRHMALHRVMYVAHNGPIPDGLCVLHNCDNRACINPDHLRQGTARDNMLDALSRNRIDLKARGESIRKAWERPKTRALHTAARKALYIERKTRETAEAGVPFDYKRCCRCREWQPLSSYCKASARYDGVQGVCKSCNAIRHRATYQPKVVIDRGCSPLR